MITKSTAGIVTYNPNIERFAECVTAVARIFDIVYIYDNASSNISEIEMLLQSFSNVKLFHQKTNFGIGKALNTIAQLAKSQENNWCLLLDQDSIVPSNILEEYSQYAEKDEIAIICPQIIENKISKMPTSKNVIEEVGVCITSGSFINLQIWKNVGGFREDFFIDSIDSEYCIRLYFLRKKILRVNTVFLNHELGKTEKRFIHSITNHNSIRRYYIARNSTYVANAYEIFNKMHYDKDEQKRANRFLDKLISSKTNIRRLFQFIFLILLYESNKFNKIQMIFRGYREGKIKSQNEPIVLNIQ